jgi:putative ABC transport system permease protein
MSRGIALRISLRELREGARGFGVFLACLALGTASVAAVRSVAAGMETALRLDGRAILGGDIALTSEGQPASAAQVRFLTRNAGPVNLVIETPALARVAGRSAAVSVKAVNPFYPMYGRMTFKDSDKTAQDMILPTIRPDTQTLGDDWGAAVAADLLAALNIKVGDTIAIGNMSFIVRGVIEREPDRAGAETAALAPRVLISSHVFARTGLADAGAQVRYDYRVAAPQVRSLDGLLALVKTIEEAFPEARWKGRTCLNASPLLAERTRQASAALMLAALAALMTGGLGVAGAVRGFLDARRNTIATLRCLGARPALVQRAYMCAVMLMAAWGTGLGLLLGATAGAAASMALGQKFALPSFPLFDVPSLVLAGAFGITAGAAFALWPVARAARLNPRDLFRDAVTPAGTWPGSGAVLGTVILAQVLLLLAVQATGDAVLALAFFALGGVAAGMFALVFLLLRAGLSRVRVPQSPALRLALANLGRRGSGTAGALVALGLGLTVLTAVALVQNNLSRMLAGEQAAGTPSFYFLGIPAHETERFKHFLETFPTAREARIAPAFAGTIAAVNGKRVSGVDAGAGVTWARALPGDSQIIDGAAWNGESREPLASVDEATARALGIRAGDTLSLDMFGGMIEARIANVRRDKAADFALAFPVILSPGLIARAVPEMRASVIVDAAREDALRDKVAEEFPAVAAVRVADALKAARDSVQLAATAVSWSAAAALLSGMLVLAGAVAAGRRRHARDAVVLKALGARASRIRAVFLIEYAALGLAAALPAAMFGAGLARLAVIRVLGAPWTFSPLPVLLVITGGMIAVLLAGHAGTARLLARKAGPYLRNQ